MEQADIRKAKLDLQKLRGKREKLQALKDKTEVTLASQRAKRTGMLEQQQQAVPSTAASGSTTHGMTFGDYFGSIHNG
jgi:hypothetical protein